jgi:SAM-dependent methyltransferase
MTTVDTTPLLAMITAYQGSATIMALCELGICDMLAVGPQDASMLAAQLGVGERDLSRLLDAAVTLDVLTKEQNRYANTALADAGLRSDSPQSVARIAAKEYQFYRAYAELVPVIRSGQAVVEPWPDMLHTDWARAHIFLLALHDLAQRAYAALPELLGPLHGHLLDVGGGVGSYALLLAAANPALHVTIFDLPPVADAARQMVAQHPAAERCHVYGGDFRRDWPISPDTKGQWDIIVLASVLHEHPPSEARQLLNKAHAALAPGGLLVVVDFDLSTNHTSPYVGAIFQLTSMLENPAAVVYDAEQMQALIQAAGFKDIHSAVLPGGPMRATWARRQE